MKKHLLHLLATTTLFLFSVIAQAQTYQPSNRIPVADNSQIGTKVAGANNQFNIDGGLQRGQNLFHSFTDFSVPTGGAAIFVNPANKSIITRVTGNLYSDINGLIDTNGSNFLLINPHGVVFGNGVNLNVGKAFVISTASSVDFVGSQGGSYNFGVNQAGDALLKIAPDVAFNPVKLTIESTSSGSKGIENYGALSSNNPAQYIGLIGGDVTFNGGQIYNQGGKVEIGGLRQSGSIGFNFEQGVKFPIDIDRGNVSLLSIGTTTSEIYTIGDGGGSVNIFAKDITIAGNDTGIKAGIDTPAGSSTTKSGNIKLDATGNISISDVAVIYNLVQATGVGTSGDIEISSRNLIAKNGGQIYTKTIGKGDSGNIKITADNIIFDGGSEGNRSGITSTIQAGAIGNAGAIDIKTRNLSITNGAAIFASTYGIGNGGNVQINANGDILLDGGINELRSGILSRVEVGAVKNAGAIDIKTRNLTITNGAGIATNTYGIGNGGNIQIKATEKVTLDGGIVLPDGNNIYSSSIASAVAETGNGKGGNIAIIAPNLGVTNGGSIAVSTAGKGDSGKIKITALNGNVTFDGGIGKFRTSAFSRSRQGAKGNAGGIEIVTGNLAVTNGAGLLANTEATGNAGNIQITALNGNVSFNGSQDGFESTAESTVEADAQGNGGEIRISAANLAITNGARLNSTSTGNGAAGNIILDSDRTTLDRGKVLSRSTNSTGGNIALTTTDYLLLQNNSQIQTDSDSTGKQSNGGNIQIQSPLLVATPGNNDITANAYNGTGGRVTIATQGLFGIKFRPKGSDFTNDITASSTFGESGTVQINTPDIDPGKDKGELPVAPNDASKQISQTCGASQRDNKFYLTGRGGLPPTANEPQESDAPWVDARATKTLTPTAQQPPQLPSPAIGWVFGKDGNVTLIAAQTAVSRMGNQVRCPTK